MAMPFENQGSELDNAAVFMARMLPYQAKGMTFVQAGRAVLEQDKKLVQLAMSPTEEGQAIRDSLMVQVYETVKL